MAAIVLSWKIPGITVHFRDTNEYTDITLCKM